MTIIWAYKSSDTPHGDYERWYTSRVEVIETSFDLLEMYTHQRSTTSVDPDFRADRFLTVRVPFIQTTSHGPEYPETMWRPQQNRQSITD
jgi:CTD kinase subunit beta